MEINKSKTKVIKFSKSRNWDFPPELKFSDGTPLECVSETMLLGVIVTQNLRWQRNTEYICAKARAKLWIIRRLSEFGLNIWTIFYVYCKEIRSILEIAVPVWHSGLTQKRSMELERIQNWPFNSY